METRVRDAFDKSGIDVLSVRRFCLYLFIITVTFYFEATRQKKYVVISLLSVTLIALEIVWTRIFSAEFFYTFAFLVLSLAVLGLGLGVI